MYKVILFDLDDTLMSLSSCEAEALRITLTNTPLKLNLSNIWSDILATYQAYSSKYWKQRATVGLSREQVIEYSLRDTLQAYDEDVTLSSQLGVEFWNIFCRTPQLNPEAKETVLALHEQYQLGIVTNGYTQSQQGRLEASGLMPLFECVVISEEAGVAKPDARIFEIALSTLRVSPADVLYIGDSIKHDFEGCRNAGIDFCYYLPQHTEADKLPVTQYKISKLSELIKLLKKAN